MVKYLFDGHAIMAIVLGGIFMLCAALVVVFVKEQNNIRIKN
jgi:hypothetical protein